MRSERGAGLLECLVGLALGLLVLQALVDALARAAQAVQAQRAALLQREAQDILHEVVRAVIEASGPPPPSGAAPAQPRLAVAPGAAGERLQVGLRARATRGLCGDASLDQAVHHVHHLDLDRAGTLRCAVDHGVAQPLADHLGRWRLHAVEASGPAHAPRWRMLEAARVRDWRRVVLLQITLRAPPPPGREAAAAQPISLCLALPPLDTASAPPPS